jgi:lipoprotein NlpD
MSTEITLMRNRAHLRVALAAVFIGLAGCAASPPAPVVDLTLPNENLPAEPAKTADANAPYRVAAGDTLYSIAFRHGLDYRDLAAWNQIAPPYRIFVGQSLRMTAPPVMANAEPIPGQAVTSGLSNGAATTPLATAGTTPKPSAFETVPETPDASPATKVSVPVAAPTRPALAGKGPASAPAAKPKAAAEPAATKSVPNAPQLSAGGVVWRWPADGTVIGTFSAGDKTRQGLDIAGKAGDPVRATADGEVVYSGNGLIGYGELIIVKHNADYLSAYGHNRKRLVKEGERVKAGQEIAEMGSSSATRDELHFEIRKNGKPVNPLDYLPAR